jgi:putative phosphoesterase
LKKILLLSDTHGFIDDQILKFVKLADEVWHAGDIGDIKVTDTIKNLKPLRAVFGNIDNSEIRVEFPLNNRFSIEGVDVWITHIGGYPQRYNTNVKEEIHKNPPDVFISGHSHILKVINDKKLKHLHLNPGAAGNSGMHKVITMMRFEIDGDRISNLEIHESARKKL